MTDFIVPHQIDEFNSVIADLTQPPGKWKANPGVVPYWLADGTKMVRGYQGSSRALVAIENGPVGIYCKLLVAAYAPGMGGSGQLRVELRKTDQGLPGYQYNDGQVSLFYYASSGLWQVYERVSGALILRASYAGDDPRTASRALEIILDTDNSFEVKIGGTTRLSGALTLTPDPVLYGFTNYFVYQSDFESDYFRLYTDAVPKGCRPAVAGTLPGAMI